MRLLSTYLEMVEHAGSNRKRELLGSIPKDIRTVHDGKVHNVRELLANTDVAATTLIQEEVYRTVIAGAQPARSMRNMIPVIPVKAGSLRINYGDAGTYAPVIAEGAPYPVSEAKETPVTFTIKKYGKRPLITRELVDDALFDIVALRIEEAAESVENSLNKLAMSNLLEGSGLEHDTAGSNQGIKAVAAAIKTIKAGDATYGMGCIPDKIIMHPEFEGILGLDYLPTGGYYQVGDVAKTGNLPPVMGLQPGSVGTNDSSSTYTWGYAADGEIGALVINSRKAGAIAMREDLHVEEYKDPIHDLVGINICSRFDAQPLIANALCRIEY